MWQEPDFIREEFTVTEPTSPASHSSLSRRRFFRSSVLAAGATAAASLPLDRGVHAAGDDTLRIGLVGCGGRGAGAAADALEADKNAKLVAMGDAFADHLESRLGILERKFPGRVVVPPERRFAGFDAYRKVIDSGVDVVLLATPPHFRPIHLAACVEAGKHVFAEKPVAVDAPGVRAVLAACDKAKAKGLSIVAGLMFRYQAEMRETMKRVHDGAIGRVVAIQETYNCGPPWFRNKKRAADWTEMEYQMRNWYVFTWLSGDHNVEQHIHSLDKAAWTMKDEPPLQAWGTGGRQIRSEIAIGHIFDHHCVTYEYADGTRLYSHCRRIAGCDNSISDTLLGTEGTADLMKHRIEGANSWRYQGPKTNMYVAEHEALFQSIRNGQPIHDGLHMARSTLLAIMGRLATYTGKVVTWEQAMNSKENLSPERYTWDANPPVLPDENGAYPIAMPGLTPLV